MPDRASAARDIVLIDDKSYGIQQVRDAIPPARRAAYQVIYFSTFEAYEAAIDGRPHVVLIDYFLDLDQLYGSEIVHRIDAEFIVGFSSSLAGSKAIVEAARQHGTWASPPQLFAIRKLKDGEPNAMLADLFRQIL